MEPLWAAYAGSTRDRAKDRFALDANRRIHVHIECQIIFGYFAKCFARTGSPTFYRCPPVNSLHFSAASDGTAALPKFRSEYLYGITNGRFSVFGSLGEWPLPISATGGSGHAAARRVFDKLTLADENSRISVGDPRVAGVHPTPDIGSNFRNGGSVAARDIRGLKSRSNMNASSLRRSMSLQYQSQVPDSRTFFTALSAYSRRYSGNAASRS